MLHSPQPQDFLTKALLTGEDNRHIDDKCMDQQTSSSLTPSSQEHEFGDTDGSLFNRIADRQDEGPDSDLDIAESSPSFILHPHEYRFRTTEENHRIGDTAEVRLRKTRNDLMTKCGIITEIDANNRVKTGTCPNTYLIK